MADFNIAVSPVQKNNKNCVDVSLEEVDLDYGQTKTIQWSVDTAAYPGATIQSITFTGNPSWGDQNPPAGATSVTITDSDHNTGNANKVFNYVVTLNYDSKTWASDPKIVNKPTTQGGGTMEGAGGA